MIYMIYYIYIYIYIHTYIHYIYIYVLCVYIPVSTTRFPLSRFSPGAGLLRYVVFHWQRLRFSRGWVRKDGNLPTETGCYLYKHLAKYD